MEKILYYVLIGNIVLVFFTSIIFFTKLRNYYKYEEEYKGSFKLPFVLFTISFCLCCFYSFYTRPVCSRCKNTLMFYEKKTECSECGSEWSKYDLPYWQTLEELKVYDT